MNGRTSINLLSILDEYFDSDALRELAYELGVDYENLVGDKKRSRCLSLIRYVEQHNQTDELLELVIKKRPFLREQLESSVDSTAEPRVYHQTLPNGLGALVEKETSVQQQGARESLWERMSFGTKVTIVSIIVTILGIIVTLVTFPETLGLTAKPTSTPTDGILLQIQVNNVGDLSAVVNAKVTLNVAEQIFAPQHTDSNGRAVFDLPANLAGTLVGIIVETDSQVETQNITVDFGMRAVEFQIRP